MGMADLLAMVANWALTGNASNNQRLGLTCLQGSQRHAADHYWNESDGNFSPISKHCFVLTYTAIFELSETLWLYILVSKLQRKNVILFKAYFKN